MFLGTVVAVILGTSWAIHAPNEKNIMSSPCLQERKIVRIILFANGGAAPLPTPLLLQKHFLLAIQNIMSSPCLKYADHVACKRGRAAPSNPPVPAIRRQHHVITMFAGKESCADHFCLQMGGGCTPSNPPKPPPPCFTAIHVCHKKEASCHHHVCGAGKLCRSFC